MTKQEKQLRERIGQLEVELAKREYQHNIMLEVLQVIDAHYEFGGSSIIETAIKAVEAIES